MDGLEVEIPRLPLPLGEKVAPAGVRLITAQVAFRSRRFTAVRVAHS